MFIFQASISVLLNTGSLPIPGHKLKIETRDTFCARLITIRDDMFLEITSRSSKVLQPYQRLASVTLNMETDLKTKLAYERIYSHTILNILCGTINKNMYHLL